MKSNLLKKHQIASLLKNVSIFLSTILFSLSIQTKSFPEENVFTINNVEVKGTVDLNFSREKYLNKAFMESFEILMSKILLSRDLEKIRNVKLKEVKNLISSFQILDENYSKDEYSAKIKILYNDFKVKKFLSQKNISFSQPENISAVFYPVLFINDNIQNFDEIFFYKNWTQVKIKNELINFILPLEDLDDISKIVENKNKIEELDIDNLINKYNVKNYAFTLMDYQNKKLNIHLKTNFKKNMISKNISYEIENMDDQIALEIILKDLKSKITDIWKEENLINLLMPLSIKLKFQHTDLSKLDKLRRTFDKISIIDDYTLEEFNINNSFFKIYYYGDPKKLKLELSKFGYKLSNNQGFWQLYLNE